MRSAERVLRGLVKKSKYERGPARHGPTRPRDAFDELTSLQRRVRLTNGILWWVAASLQPWMEPKPIHMCSHCGTCKVRGCKNWLLSFNSGMDMPIVTKFGLCLEAKSRCILHRSWVAYICTSAPADVPPFSYIGNVWTDCAEIRFVFRDLLAWRFTKVSGGVQVHVHTPFSVSRDRLDRLRWNLVCG